jgi:ABC-type nitrate/sulfonate/bicarbonate transport system permease component
MTKRGSRRAIEIGLTLLAPAILLIGWELLSRSGRVNAIFWPPPSSLWDTARTMLVDDALLRDVRISLERIVIGFLLGAIPGIALGLGMGLSWSLRVLMMPLATALYAIPKIALLPLVIIALGTGETAKWAIVAISIFFLVALNTMSGVMNLDPIFRDVARNFNASRWQTFFGVALPGSLPAIFTGLRLGLGFSLIVIVGTEFLSPREGIGALIWRSYSILAIEQMYVGLIVTGILGWLLVLALDLIERLVVPWNRKA